MRAETSRQTFSTKISEDSDSRVNMSILGNNVKLYITKYGQLVPLRS